MYVLFESLDISSREYAILTWIIVLSFFILIKRNQLDLITDVINSILKVKILIPIILYAGSFIICIWILYSINFWNISFLKMTFLWFVIEGILILFNTILAEDFKKVNFLFKDYIKQALSVSTILVLFINLYTFNYFFELILTLILIVLGIGIVLTKAIVKKEGDKQATLLNLAYLIVSLITIALLLYTSIRFIMNFDINNLISLFHEYFMAILFTVWVIPIVYIFKLYSTYEVMWIRLKSFNYIPDKMKKRFFLSVIKNCHIDYRKLNLLKNDPEWKRTKFDNAEKIKEYFKDFNNKN